MWSLTFCVGNSSISPFCLVKLHVTLSSPVKFLPLFEEKLVIFSPHGAHNRWLFDFLQYFKLSADQYERDLLSVVNSLLRSINDTDLHLVMSGPCNASCIRFSLVKLLRISGYDAAVCSSKWQGGGKVPGGTPEFNQSTFLYFLQQAFLRFPN